MSSYRDQYRRDRWRFGWICNFCVLAGVGVGALTGWLCWVYVFNGYPPNANLSIIIGGIVGTIVAIILSTLATIKFFDLSFGIKYRCPRCQVDVKNRRKICPECNQEL